MKPSRKTHFHRSNRDRNEPEITAVLRAAGVRYILLSPGAGADLLLVINPMAFVEVKSADGKLTEVEKAVRWECEERGIPYWIVRSADEMVAALNDATAAAGVAGGAKRVCLVASGRGPTDRDVKRVGETISAIKENHPGVEVCACLGLLSDGQADKLREAGADAYNHNLNTAEEQYKEICSTHTFTDRVETVQQAKQAGLSPCSGLIAGMGESDEDLVDVVFALKELDPDSIPVNFLIPFDGTPLERKWELTPQRCLRILAMVRLVCPDIEVRLAGGREIHLRTLQPLALHVVNSIFLGDYLTSEGEAGETDLAMIADAGFVVEGQEDTTLPEHRHDLVKLRQRGAGTELAPNA